MENKIKTTTCKRKLQAISDVSYIIGGKWKIPIITSLCFGDKRYSEILNDIEGISGKMLSHELKELEINQLISRKVLDTKPIGVEYSLTECGNSLKSIIDIMADWGLEYRVLRQKTK